MSNIWESMQRGLEKASHEAARIGRIQRLRYTVDSLSRQLSTQNNLLVTRAMEVFAAGQMTQSELLPLCQDLVILQQQLDQAQHELKALMNQGTPPAQAGQTPTGPNPITGGEIAPTVPIPLMPSVPTAPPPPGYATLESTMPIPAPPPPPGVQGNSLDTLFINPSNPPSGAPAPRCPQCQVELIPGNTYCHNCGSYIDHSAGQHLPTMRSGFYPAGPETPHAEATETAEEQPTIYTPGTTPPPPPHVADLETIHGEIPAQESEGEQAKDGGQ